jgi:hypothetical protein
MTSKAGLPQGQMNGGRPYREITFHEQANPALQPDGTATDPVLVPWGAGGFKKGTLVFDILGANAGTLSVIVQQMPTWQSALPSDSGVLPTLVFTVAVSLGSYRLTMNWDDGVWPGNWSADNTGGGGYGPTDGGSNNVNPTWQMAAENLAFQLVNNTGANIAVQDIYCLLGG